MMLSNELECIVERLDQMIVCGFSRAIVLLEDGCEEFSN